MPAPPQIGPNYNTVLDVNNRVRSIVNDDNAQLYPDNATKLVNAVRNAYTWLYGQIVRISGGGFIKTVIDIPYTPTTSGEEQNLNAILPFDLYMPIDLEFRLNTNEEYVPVDRKQNIRSRNTEQIQRVNEWEFRGNTIIVTSSNQPGFFKLRYHALIANIAVTSDPILITNSVEAIAHYAAYELFRSRGQFINAQATLGDDGSRNGGIPTGAKGFASMILDHIILNEQEEPRRGSRFGEAGVDNVSNRQSNE